MNDRTPVDQDVRDAIRTSLNDTLFVEAGAGTGKTTSLVDRVIALVAAGHPITGIAAITFTEMAAAELVDRVREQLELAALDPARPHEGRDRMRIALSELDIAPIQTLHAFARRILAAYPVEAGLPPGFEVVDDVGSILEFDRRWSDFLDEFLGAEGPAPELEYLYGLGMRTGHLKKIAVALHYNWDRAPAHETMPTVPPFDDGPLRTLLSELLTLDAGCTDPADRLYDRLQDLKPIAESVGPGESVPARLRAWRSSWSSRGLGRAPSWGGRVGEVRDRMAELESQRRSLLQGHAGHCLELVLAAISAFVRRYAAERREAGRLQFHDLLVYARNLLRDEPAVRDALHQRIACLLIDEFQDTDPLQVEIAALLARDYAIDASRPWDAAPVPAGSLFVVGDPKQSIYRFRRADVELYTRARAALGGTPVDLVQNFRSLPPVIDWVNHVFELLMAPGVDAGQARYEPLASWHATSGETSGVYHLDAPEAPNADLARETEAAAIALVIDDLCARGVSIREGDQYRAVRRSDIAVIFRTRTPVPALEAAFDDAGIPYRVESRALIYESQEVRDLIAILQSLVDPSDEVALVAALRSPAFACSDRDLYQYAAAGGRWNYLRPLDHDEGRVANAMQWLREHHAAALTDPVHLTLATVLDERRLFESATALRRPRQRWQRYRFMQEQARAFAAQPDGDLRRFVAWLHAQRANAARVVETAAPETDDDAVRLLTVHAAKGLEFPVVILAGLATDPRDEDPALLFGPGSLESKLGRKESLVRTPGYDEALARDDELDEHEEVRALYVAATRARDILVVSLVRSKGQTRGMLPKLIQALPVDDETYWRPYPLPAELASLPEAPPSSAPSPTPADLDAWREQRAARLATLTSGNAIAATAIARLGVAFEDPGTVAPHDESRPWRRGRAGTSVGRAVHAVLQVADLATGDGVETAARLQATAEGIPGRESAIAALAAAALGTTTVREACAAAGHWREVFVSASIEGHLLEGFIDLLYESERGLVVVDYKTDALRDDAEVDAAVARYRLQVAAYALALEATLGRPVAACRFLFLSRGRAVERTIDDLAVACAEVRSLLAATPPGTFAAEPTAPAAR